MVAAARIEDRSLEGGSLPPNELAKGTKRGAEYARYHAEKNRVLHTYDFRICTIRACMSLLPGSSRVESSRLSE